MINIVAAIIEKDGKYLISKRSTELRNYSGYWSPICGEVEKGESQTEAVERESKEEVNLDIKAKDKICEYVTNDNSGKLHWWTTEILSGEAKVVSDELAEIRWVTIQEMKRLHPMNKEDYKVFETYNSKKCMKLKHS